MGDKDPHGRGNRERLRRRFLKRGLSGLADYEVVELLLSLAIPRRSLASARSATLGRNA